MQSYQFMLSKLQSSKWEDIAIIESDNDFIKNKNWNYAFKAINDFNTEKQLYQNSQITNIENDTIFICSECYNGNIHFYKISFIKRILPIIFVTAIPEKYIAD